jgi:hypothetical protein
VQQLVSTIQDEAKAWAYAGNKGLQQLLLTMQNGHFDVPSQRAVDSVAVVISSM